jgi:hypothetical protein
MKIVAYIARNAVPAPLFLVHVYEKHGTPCQTLMWGTHVWLNTIAEDRLPALARELIEQKPWQGEHGGHGQPPRDPIFETALDFNRRLRVQDDEEERIRQEWTECLERGTLEAVAEGNTTNTFGGRQEGAGRPSLPPEKRKVRRVLYLPPDLDGWLIDEVGNGRAAVEREIIRIVELYRDTPQVL